MIIADDISTAWLDAAEFLMDQPDWHTSNLAVAISQPTTERPAIRTELDDFLRQAGADIPGVTTVAGTIFQQSFYRPSANDPRQHLYNLERDTRRVVRRHPANRRGTYFQRLVAWPQADGGEFNQLEATVVKLRTAAERGHRNGNKYELSVFHPLRDTNPLGFPCLSHVSVTLRDGYLDLTALYRNQYFISRAYGNYVGLAQLLRFLAAESGFEVGELLCIASHGRLDTDHCGKTQVRELLERCQAAGLQTGEI